MEINTFTFNLIYSLFTVFISIISYNFGKNSWQHSELFLISTKIDQINSFILGMKKDIYKIHDDILEKKL